MPAGWGVLVMWTVMLEASCPAQLPRAGGLRAGELLVTLWPLLWLLPPGWHGVMDRLPGEGWGQMGMGLPWATYPGLTTITAQHCQAQWWSEPSAPPWGLAGCHSRFHQGSVSPTGLSAEQVPLLHASWVPGGWEESTREPPEARGSLSVLHRAPLGRAALSSKEARPLWKKQSL